MRVLRQNRLKKRMDIAYSPSATLLLSCQFADAGAQTIAARSTLRRWVSRALEQPAHINLRFVSQHEGRALNSEYRGKDYATNVLTFAYPHTRGQPLQADIILCTAVVRAEAKAQRKTVRDHLAHLVIHGVLHAQGYDHENDRDAQRMEAREVELLASLRIRNPYAV
ncbi:MAG: rRNA maturation RNase YbeY [Pseudomonadota bacterium]|jgi:probable rRNA maturation factor